MRDALGLDPYDNAAADRPMVLTATGYVPIEAKAGGKGTDAPVAPDVVQHSLGKVYDPNEPRVPAGNSKGGQWTTGGTQYAANVTPIGSQSDSPGIGHNQEPPPEPPPKIPTQRPDTTKELNVFLKAAARWLSKAALLGEAATYGAFYGALATEMWLDPSAKALIDSYQDPPKTLAELQQDALTPKPGYDIHHIGEQTAARNDGIRTL
jgi:hypothetical protein